MTSNNQTMMTFKGERLHGRLTEMSALASTFKCSTFIKHLLYEIFGLLALPVQLFYEGVGFTILMGSYPCGSCIRSCTYYSNKRTNRCQRCTSGCSLASWYYQTSHFVAMPLLVWSLVTVYKIPRITNDHTSHTSLAGLVATILTYVSVFVLHAVAISIKYATQPALALEALKRKPEQNLVVWQNFHMGTFKHWHPSQLFERMQILLTVDGMETHKRENFCFNLRFGSHKDAKDHVQRLLEFIFPNSIPTLKSDVIRCLEHHEYLSTIEITQCNCSLQARGSTRGTGGGGKSSGDDAHVLYNVKVPALLIGIALTMQEKVGTQKNKCVKLLLLVCVFFISVFPSLIMYFTDRPRLYFDSTKDPFHLVNWKLKCTTGGGDAMNALVCSTGSGSFNATDLVLLPGYNATQKAYNASMVTYCANQKDVGFFNFLTPGPRMINFYYCMSYEKEQRDVLMALWGLSIVCLIPLLSIDLSFIQLGAAAYFRQHNILRHLDSAIAPGSRVTINDRARKNETHGLNDHHHYNHDSLDHLKFQYDPPLLQLISMSNIETYLTLRKVLRHLYDNIFYRAQVVMIAFTLVMGFLILYLIFINADPNVMYVQLDFILIVFSVIFTGTCLLLSFIYAQTRANTQTDTASRALLYAQVSFVKFYKHIVGEEHIQYDTIQHMEKALKTGRRIFLDEAAKFPHKIFGVRADSALLTQLFSVMSTLGLAIVSVFATKFK